MAAFLQSTLAFVVVIVAILHMLAVRDDDPVHASPER